MRARRGLILGWVLVGLYAAALLAVTVTTRDGELRPGDRGPSRDDASAFVAAWQRSLEATFLRTATFERRSEATGAVISSEDVLAQRPPQRLHRQLGGVEGRDGRRAIVCGGPLDDETAPSPPCALGPPTLPSYEADVETTIEALRTQVEGPSPVYAVADIGHGCFELAQQRIEPRASFGQDARFCFDGETGAPTNSRVRYAAGIVEVLAVTNVIGEVSDADLEP
jgi:hypothetical protein